MQSIYDRRGNVDRVRKNFYVNIELFDGNIYDIYFRSNGDRDERPEQSAILKNTFINEKVGFLPVFIENTLAYIDVKTDVIVMKSSMANTPMYYEGFELVTYDMFDGVKWSGCFSYPPA
jgi:hypothetical protein